MKRAEPMKRSGFKPSVAKPAPGRKPRKCAVKTCRKPFIPFRALESWCSPECGLHVATARTAAQKAKAARAERAADKVKREGLKTRPQLVREAQAEVNKYVRLRDDGLPCISCGITYSSDRNDVWDAGHLRSAGSSPGTRFNTLNIHKQCVRCNQYLSSNALKYRIALIEKIGLALVEKIECHSGVAKFSHEYLVRLKNIFRRRVRHLSSLRERIDYGKNKKRGA